MGNECHSGKEQKKVQRQGPHTGKNLKKTMPPRLQTKLYTQKQCLTYPKQKTELTKLPRWLQQYKTRSMYYQCLFVKHYGTQIKNIAHIKNLRLDMSIKQHQKRINFDNLKTFMYSRIQTRAMFHKYVPKLECLKPTCMRTWYDPTPW